MLLFITNSIYSILGAYKVVVLLGGLLCKSKYPFYYKIVYMMIYVMYTVYITYIILIIQYTYTVYINTRFADGNYLPIYTEIIQFDS